MKKIFAVMPFIQKDEVDKYCFGECGKVLCGGLLDVPGGAGFPCREENCPHEERRAEWGKLKLTGETVFLRKLKEIKNKVK